MFGPCNKSSPLVKVLTSLRFDIFVFADSRHVLKRSFATDVLLKVVQSAKVYILDEIPF